jgi:hypothetical protein
MDNPSNEPRRITLDEALHRLSDLEIGALLDVEAEQGSRCLDLGRKSVADFYWALCLALDGERERRGIPLEQLKKMVAQRFQSEVAELVAAQQPQGPVN